ncbi:siderophore-interacting protein [Pseudochelatococcus sp. B33]
MTDIAPSPSSRTRRPGRLAQVMGQLFARPARIVESRAIGSDFVVLTLESPQFIGLDWTPGQKVQIAVGPTLTYRTYTPIEWDSRNGRTRLLAYVHGDGPGSDWSLHAKVGDGCNVYGPRASLDLGSLKGPTFLFGDETSFAVAIAMAARPAAGVSTCLFEVNANDASRQASAEFGLERAELLTRTQDDAHLEQVGARLASANKTDATFVLTGKATSIQRIRAMLKQHGVPGGRVMTKAYWAPGKKGLD